MLDRIIKIFTWAVFAFAMLGMPLAAFAVSGKTEELVNCSASCDGSYEVNTSSYTNAVVQVCCTFTATVTFKSSVDGTNFDAIEGFSTADKTVRTTSATSRGQWRFNINSMNKFEVVVSGYSSGTILVTVGLSSAGVN
jgi:hypothetical protein